MHTRRVYTVIPAMFSLNRIWKSKTTNSTPMISPMLLANTNAHISLSPPQSLWKQRKKNKPTFFSNNRYSVLDTNDSNENTLNKSTTDSNNDNNNENEQPQHIPSPPPIFVRNIKNYFIFRNKLINLIGPLNFTCKSTANNLKINTKNSDLYRTVIKHLNTCKLELHTYQSQEQRAFRVVFRNLHPSTPTVEIGIAIQDLGFSVRQVSNVLNKITKNPLPLFFIDLEPAEINKEIFNVITYFTQRLKSRNLTNEVKSFNVSTVRNTDIRNLTVLTLRNASVVLLPTQPHRAPNPKTKHQPVPYVEAIIRLATVAVRTVHKELQRLHNASTNYKNNVT